MNKLTKHRKGLKERIRREKDMYLNENTEIVSVRKDLEEISVLDPTFKWNRDYNNVSFDTTHYYPKEITTPLYVDLYKVDSVYY